MSPRPDPWWIIAGWVLTIALACGSAGYLSYRVAMAVHP